MQPKYYTIDSGLDDWSPWAITAWWSKDAERATEPSTPQGDAMLAYICKRLLLMIPTLLGVLTVTFVLIQFVPGGPVEQIVAEMRAGQGRRHGGGFAGGATSTPSRSQELKKLYGFDKPPLERYVEHARELRALRPRQELHAATRTSGS